MDWGEKEFEAVKSTMACFNPFYIPEFVASLQEKKW